MLSPHWGLQEVLWNGKAHAALVPEKPCRKGSQRAQECLVSMEDHSTTTKPETRVCVSKVKIALLFITSIVKN